MVKPQNTVEVNKFFKTVLSQNLTKLFSKKFQLKPPGGGVPGSREVAGATSRGMTRTFLSKIESSDFEVSSDNGSMKRSTGGSVYWHTAAQL